MRTKLIFMALMLVPVLATAQIKEKDFVKGADVGFLTNQERQGVVFHDRQGRERECLELLKNDYQIGAIRMRVWVNPRGGSCDKNELLAMARRVKALGMDLMVNFHYSDWWADPAKQPIPKAWLGHDYEQMKQRKAEQLIAAVCKEHPGLVSQIAGYETSTPLTYFDYTGTENGSMYGIAKDVSLGPAAHVHHRTKIPNLLLTGQNVNSHGILGVIVGTIVTCSELLTAEHIFNEIMNANRK
jgi:hypothetical protein